MKDEKTKDPLSDDEIDRLIRLMAAQDGGTTEEEAGECVRWARKVRVEATFLELILGGVVEVRFNKAGVPVFALTRKGRKDIDRYKHMVKSGQYGVPSDS